MPHICKQKRDKVAYLEASVLCRHWVRSLSEVCWQTFSYRHVLHQYSCLLLHHEEDEKERGEKEEEKHEEQDLDRVVREHSWSNSEVLGCATMDIIVVIFLVSMQYTEHDALALCVLF